MDAKEFREHEGIGSGTNITTGMLESFAESYHQHKLTEQGGEYYRKVKCEDRLPTIEDNYFVFINGVKREAEFHLYEKTPGHMIIKANTWTRDDRHGYEYEVSPGEWLEPCPPPQLDREKVMEVMKQLEGNYLVSSATIDKMVDMICSPSTQPKEDNFDASFWKRLKTFVEEVQVGDPMSEDEKDMILHNCNTRLAAFGKEGEG